MFKYDRLEQLIKESGKKKQYLCSQMGKCPTYLRDAKKQNTNIRGEELAILARELNTTPEYLQGETDEKNKPTADNDDELTNEFIQLFNRLSPEEQIRELAYLRSLSSSNN